jgi:hypothetical protein
MKSTQLSLPPLETGKRSINDLNYLITSRSHDVDPSIRTNDDLNLLCPVNLHFKMAFEKFDHDCRCKKQTVPCLFDLEFDYLMKMLPSDQLAVVVIIDSKYHYSFIVFFIFSITKIYLTI